MMKKYDCHVFICSSCRYAPDPGQKEELNPEGESQNLRKTLKEKYKKNYPNKNVRISSSSCLGRCEEGITCLLYPQGQWLTDLRPQNIEEIVFKAINYLIPD